MIQITYMGMFAFITICWIVARLICARVNKSVNIKYELKLLTVYACIVVIARYVYFPFQLENGHITPVIFDIHKAYPFKCNFKMFLFLEQKYEGYKINILGNIAMFVPVGIVLPFCFKNLNNIIKVTLVGLCCTLFIEISQLPLYQRRTDIDDVLLNTIGVFIGALVYFEARAVYEFIKEDRKDSKMIAEN